MYINWQKHFYVKQIAQSIPVKYPKSYEHEIFHCVPQSRKLIQTTDPVHRITSLRYAFRNFLWTYASNKLFCVHMTSLFIKVPNLYFMRKPFLSLL